MIIHQIFGLLDDEMPELFVNCRKKVLDWCFKNNYDYILWDKNKCENLIDKYPEYKAFYQNVKYKIMQVDIIRFLILFEYGGVYLDLDITPNIDKLKPYQFAIAYKKGIKREHFEIEVIQSYKNNKILLQFLDYAKQQVIDKDKVDIYKTWKCRYVYQTTGPYSFSRFVKINKLLIDKYIINEPTTKDNNLNLNGNEDFISHPSCSYLNTF